MQSLIYHFLENFIPFAKTFGNFWMILHVRGATATQGNNGVMSGMHGGI